MEPPLEHDSGSNPKALPERAPGFSSLAKWIWIPGEESPVNAFVDFQGELEIDAIPSAARVLISADSRYRLHLNGHLVGDGPARNYPGSYEFDSYEVAPLLQPGRNVLDVRVHHWGEGTFQGLVLRAGLICEVQCDAGTLLASSKSWRGRPAKAYQFPTPRVACQLGFEEQVDLKQEQGATDGRIASGNGFEIDTAQKPTAVRA